MEDKATTRRHLNIPICERTARRALLDTWIQKRTRRAQIQPHTQELQKLQRVGRGEKPRHSNSIPTTRQYSSRAHCPERTPAPPLPPRQVAVIQEWRRT